MARKIQGQVAALFAFDFGYEAPLERLSAMFATTPVQPLSRRKRTPPYSLYTRPPQILSPGLAMGHFAVAGSIQATIFDFGAAGVAYRRPAWRKNDVSLEGLAHVSQDRYDLDIWLHAKLRAKSLMESAAAQTPSSVAKFAPEK